MSQKISIPVAIRLDDPACPPSLGSVTREVWSKPERNLKAMKAALLTMGLAIVCVFIPIAHFILVPGFLFLTVLVFIGGMNVQSAIIGGGGSCPKCQAAFEVAKSADRWPLKDVCSHCQVSLKIFLTDEAQPS